MAPTTGSPTSITALGADGFTVGDSATVNANGITYHYVAINDVAGIADIGTYTGNNTDNRNITGVGLSPAYVSLRANDTAAARTTSHRPSSLAGDATMFFTNRPTPPTTSRRSRPTASSSATTRR